MKKKSYHVISLILVLLSFAHVTISNEIVTDSYTTPLGPAVELKSTTDGGDIYLLTLNEQPIFSTRKSPFRSVSIKVERREISGKRVPGIVQKSLFEFEDGGGATGCLTRYFIVDFTGKEPVVTIPFDDGHCNHPFDTSDSHVKWGKNESRIYTEYGEFVYKNGVVTRVKVSEKPLREGRMPVPLDPPE